jgi:hypothetical protein
MSSWLGIADKVEVTYPTAQGNMGKILGVVLHTTNTGFTALTVENIADNWQKNINDPKVPSDKKVSAHFVVEQGGRIGQCRALNDVAWHLGDFSRHYIGIEHICRTQSSEILLNAQIAASAKLLRGLRNELGFELKPLKQKNSSGVGVHQQFHSTGCGGNGVFWSGSHQSGQVGKQFWDVLQVPSGRWEVRVGDWTWIYIFYDTGVVEWQALSIKDWAKDTGTGQWHLDGNLHIIWNNGSIEDWNKPLAATTTGRLSRQANGVAEGGGLQLTEDERKIVAHRLDLPKK